MKRIVVFFVALLLAAPAYGRKGDLPVINPTIGSAPDLSEKAQKEFAQRDKLIEKLNKGVSVASLTSEERELLDKYGESGDMSIWDVMDGGCSWYCGGGPYKVSASSALKPSGNITYEAGNAHDFSFKSAWVEGVSGYGKGEYLEYLFQNRSPRVTDVNIYNGYLKSEAAWQKNSRVKRLKLFVNNSPYAILELQDTRALQTFKLNEPLGRSSDGKDLVLKFEIVEVYKGDVYDDTAITELFFDGIDVHCLAKGTRIATPEGDRPIETISAGDLVRQYDPVETRMTFVTVSRIIKADHAHLLVLTFEDGSTVKTTADHPFWIEGKGWCTYQPAAVQARCMGRYVLGDRFLVYDEMEKMEKVGLKEIGEVEAPAEMYTLELETGESFLANGLVTGTEHGRE